MDFIKILLKSLNSIKNFKNKVRKMNTNKTNLKNLNVNHNLYYSYDNYNFNDNFSHLKGEKECLIYTEYNQLSEEMDYYNFITVDENKNNRIELLKYLKKEDNYFLYSEYKNHSNQELFNYCLDLLYNINISEIEYLLNNYLNITYINNYDYIVSRGYSQGDYAKVYINLIEFEKLTGVKFEAKKHQKIFDNYLWDSPIDGNIEINFDIEYYNNLNNETFIKNYNFNIDVIDFIFDEYDYNNLLDYNSLMDYIKKETYNNLNREDYLIIENKIKDFDYYDIRN